MPPEETIQSPNTSPEFETQQTEQEYIHRHADGTVETAATAEDARRTCPYLGKLSVEAAETTLETVRRFSEERQASSPDASKQIDLTKIFPSLANKPVQPEPKAEPAKQTLQEKAQPTEIMPASPVQLAETAPAAQMQEVPHSKKPPVEPKQPGFDPEHPAPLADLIQHQHLRGPITLEQEIMSNIRESHIMHEQPRNEAETPVEYAPAKLTAAKSHETSAVDNAATTHERVEQARVTEIQEEATQDAGLYETEQFFEAEAHPNTDSGPDSTSAAVEETVSAPEISNGAGNESGAGDEYMPADHVGDEAETTFEPIATFEDTLAENSPLDILEEAPEAVAPNGAETLALALDLDPETELGEFVDQLSKSFIANEAEAPESLLILPEIAAFRPLEEEGTSTPETPAASPLKQPLFAASQARQPEISPVVQGLQPEVAEAITKLKAYISAADRGQGGALKLTEQVVKDIIPVLVHLGHDKPHKALLDYAKTHSLEELFIELEQILPELTKLIDYQQHLLQALTRAQIRSDRRMAIVHFLRGVLFGAEPLATAKAT